MIPGPRKSTDPAREAPPLPPVQYPSNPSPSARFGRWVMGIVQRLMGD